MHIIQDAGCELQHPQMSTLWLERLRLGPQALLLSHCAVDKKRFATGAVVKLRSALLTCRSLCGACACPEPQAARAR